MSFDRKRQGLPIQGQGREAVVQSFRSDRYLGEQCLQTSANTTDPLLLETDLLPLVTRTCGFLTFKLSHHGCVAPT